MFSFLEGERTKIESRSKFVNGYLLSLEYELYLTRYVENWTKKW